MPLSSRPGKTLVARPPGLRLGFAPAPRDQVRERGQADVTLGFTILAFGGPALFLLAQLLFQHAVLGRAPRSRALGIAALAILAIAAAPLT